MKALRVLKVPTTVDQCSLSCNCASSCDCVLGPHLEVIERRIAAKAQISSGQIALKVRSVNSPLVGEFGVGVRPVPLTDLARKILDRSLRCRSRGAADRWFLHLPAPQPTHWDAEC